MKYLIILLLPFMAYASESIYTRASRISCDMVRNQDIHWAEKVALRRVYFKAVYEEFETNPISDVDELAKGLGTCEE